MYGIDLNSPLHYEFASFRFFEKKEQKTLKKVLTKRHPFGILIERL